MDFYDLVARRSSIRSFDTQKTVPEPVLQRILNAGRMAPSAKNLQPWRFIVVRTASIKEKIYPAYPRDWIRNAPILLIVAGRRDQAWVRSKDGYNSLETDLTIAMDHLILAAAWEGVGSCWIAAFDPTILHEALQLEASEEIFAFTPLGYAAPGSEPMPKNRKALEEIVEFL
ncbi:MAG: nitroreductase [Chlorobiaceae bacterium]|nr:nitroreductase [Chlorobiaceae bacterium]